MVITHSALDRGAKFFDPRGKNSLDQTSVFCGAARNEINLSFEMNTGVIKHQLHHKVGSDDNENESLINAFKLFWLKIALIR